MNAVSIHKRNWFFAASCVALVSVNTPPAGAQQECCEQSAPSAIASEPQENEYLGQSIAVDGSRALAGAPNFDANIPFVTGSGRVLEFNFTMGSWVQGDVLRADAEFTNDLFGLSVALDGDFAVIGAPGDSDNDPGSGSAYIFQRVLGSWIEVVELHADDGEENEAFGWSVAIQGDLAVIGAVSGDKDALEMTGAVYIFDRTFEDPDPWSQVEKLNASDAASFDQFGHSVSIDGPLIVVGAPGAGPPTFAGAAYIFRFDDPTWEEEEILDLVDPVTLDRFGTSVSVAGDRAIIGAPFRDHDQLEDSGEAYVFHYNSQSMSWTEEQILSGCAALVDDQLGTSVSIYEKPANAGFVAIVGAIQTQGAGGNGRAEVFGYRGAGWAPLHQLTASDGGAFDNFGTAVSIKGGTAVVGALGWDDTDDEGAIYGFDGLDTAPSCVCPGDLDDDGDVGVSDLLLLLAAWGPCDECTACPEDLDGNCMVGVGDLLILLANWGPCMDEAIPLEDAQDCIDKFYPDDMDALIACIEAFGG